MQYSNIPGVHSPRFAPVRLEGCQAKKVDSGIDLTVPGRLERLTLALLLWTVESAGLPGTGYPVVLSVLMPIVLGD